MKKIREFEDREEEFLRGKDVASLLKISYPTLISWVRYGIIPSYRIGKSTIRYRRSDIDKIVGKGIRNFTVGGE